MVPCPADLAPALALQVTPQRCNSVGEVARGALGYWKAHTVRHQIESELVGVLVPQAQTPTVEGTMQASVGLSVPKLRLQHFICCTNFL